MPVGKIREDSHTMAEHRMHFPGLANKAYLNYGGQGVMPREAIEDISTAFELVQNEGPFSMRVLSWITDQLQQTRESLAEEIGGRPESFAISQNATEGCNIVFWGIDWEPGDHIIITDCEHFGVKAAAENLVARHNSQLSVVNAKNADDRSLVDALAGLIQPRTKLVALSHVLWNTGRILPIKDIQKLCRSTKVRLLVDGAQSAGILPLDLEELDIDFFAFPGHKWMCGPEGISALYIRPELINELRPTFVGWRGTYLSERDKNTAARFEVGTSPFPLLCGLRAALGVHKIWGAPHERFEKMQENVRTMRDGLKKLGAELILDDSLAPSNLVSFSMKETGVSLSHNQIVSKLESEHVLVRSIPAPDCLRASVHYFTDETDVQRLLDGLNHIVQAN